MPFSFWLTNLFFSLLFSCAWTVGQCSAPEQNINKTVILKIEVQGAQQIKKLYPDAVGIFVLPPSMEELENRLRSRGTEDEEDIQKRLEIAKNEVEKSVDYDYTVINDDLDSASNDVLKIINAL